MKQVLVISKNETGMITTTAQSGAVMHSLSLSEVARVTGGELFGADVTFDGVSIDSRTLQAGSLFVALQGPRFDGHSFIDDAASKGAVAAIVMHRQQTDLPQVVVPDSNKALQIMATAWRAAFDIPVIAITGSNGKTTVKEMTAAILQQQAPILVTTGNLNNEIGVPLTLMGLRQHHRYAVIEMGANHPGEISHLCQMAQPTVSLVNNVGSAHLEGFGDLAGVARAKGEIFQALQVNDTAVINVDDAFAATWLETAKECQRISFGLSSAAQVTTDAAQISSSFNEAAGSFITRFPLQTPQGETEINLQLPGQHNVMNALASAAVAHALDISLQQIKAGLESMPGVKGRLQVKSGPQGATLIDDTYNANPSSVAAALEVLSGFTGKRILVLGDMGELGDTSPELHADIGTQAREQGIEELFAVGEMSQAAVESFGEGARHFPDHDALQTALLSSVTSDSVVLFKGSRFMHMEDVVDVLETDAHKGGYH